MRPSLDSVVWPGWPVVLPLAAAVKLYPQDALLYLEVLLTGSLLLQVGRLPESLSHDLTGPAWTDVYRIGVVRSSAKSLNRRI